MRSLGIWFGALLLVSAPATAQMIHLNCPPQNGQGDNFLFTIDFGESTVTIRFVDRAGLVTSSGRERWPATITDEIVRTEKTFGGGRVGPITEIYTINRYAATVRRDCGGSGCMGPSFYGPCTQERTPERRRQF